MQSHAGDSLRLVNTFGHRVSYKILSDRPDKSTLRMALEDLKVYQKEEPNSGWHLESFGPGGWHRADVPALQALLKE